MHDDPDQQERMDRETILRELEVKERYLDPATAPQVPILFTMDWAADKNPHYDVEIRGWDRHSGKKMIFRFQCNDATLTVDDLDENDIIWLRNIGARP